MISPEKLIIPLFLTASACFTVSAFLSGGAAAGIGVLGACLAGGFLFSLLSLI